MGSTWRRGVDLETCYPKETVAVGRCFGRAIGMRCFEAVVVGFESEPFALLEANNGNKKRGKNAECS